MERVDDYFSLDVMERGNDLRDAILDGDFERVKACIDSRTCQLNEADDHGRTGLHLAACRGYSDIIKLLADNGADVKAVDRHGNTSLHWCGHVDSVEILVEYGADINARNSIGFTPRKLAERRGIPEDVMQLFKHLEKQKKDENRSSAPRGRDGRQTISSRASQTSFIMPSIWYEFYCEMGARNMCLLILGLLTFSLYIAYILTGFHRGSEQKIALDSQSYKVQI